MPPHLKTCIYPRLARGLVKRMNKISPVSRSGRFAGDPAAEVTQFTQSVSFDQRLWRHDILGSLVHADLLQTIGVLSRAERNAIVHGLKAIAREIEQSKFRWKPALEDVHMNIEAELTRRVPAGAKLHTARSRNDQRKHYSAPSALSAAASGSP